MASKEAPRRNSSQDALGEMFSEPPTLCWACILCAAATGQVGLLPRVWAAGTLKACAVQCQVENKKVVR